MRRMGRQRKDNPLGLPPRCYAKHGAFYYVTRDNKWERLGTDMKAAIAEARRRNEGTGYGTMRWWYSEFLAYCRARIGKPKSERGISQRTYDDYEDAGKYLIAFFGDMTPRGVDPSNVGEYLSIGASAGRPVRANREKAALSACFTWLMLQSEAGVKANPCAGVKRNPEEDRDRYVEDDEYRAVREQASQSVRTMMDLIYRTLQRPDDVLHWTTANLGKRNGQDVIRARQGKTGHRIEIAISPEIDAILRDVGIDRGAQVVPLRRPLIARLDGFEYTYDGISANLKRAIAAANRKRKKEGKTPIPSFGFQDLKAKGATDMFQAGVPLEQIRELCAHDSVTTTEIYVKRRLRKVVEPNAVRLSNIQ